MADESANPQPKTLRLEDIPEEARDMALAEAEKVTGGLMSLGTHTGGTAVGKLAAGYTFTEPQNPDDIYRIDD